MIRIVKLPLVPELALEGKNFMATDDIQDVKNNRPDKDQTPNENLETDGTVVQGDVHTGGGQFVGRDSIINNNTFVYLTQPQEENPMLKIPGYLDEHVIHEILVLLSRVPRGETVGLDTLSTRLNISKDIACEHLEFLEKEGLVEQTRIYVGASTIYSCSLTEQGLAYTHRKPS